MQELESQQVMSYNPQELVRWCRNRKSVLGLSNAKISEIAKVPIGTVDRILSGNYQEFRYSSIQPIIAVLIGIDEETPKPDKKDLTQPDYYYETIEGYKLIVENKNRIIDGLKKDIEELYRQLKFIDEENTQKQKTIESLCGHITWLQKHIDEKLS